MLISRFLNCKFQQSLVSRNFKFRLSIVPKKYREFRQFAAEKHSTLGTLSIICEKKYCISSFSRWNIKKKFLQCISEEKLWISSCGHWKKDYWFWQLVFGKKSLISWITCGKNSWIFLIARGKRLHISSVNCSKIIVKYVDRSFMKIANFTSLLTLTFFMKTFIKWKNLLDQDSLNWALAVV